MVFYVLEARISSLFLAYLLMPLCVHPNSANAAAVNVSDVWAFGGEHSLMRQTRLLPVTELVDKAITVYVSCVVAYDAGIKRSAKFALRWIVVTGNTATSLPNPVMAETSHMPRFAATELQNIQVELDRNSLCAWWVKD